MPFESPARARGSQRFGVRMPPAPALVALRARPAARVRAPAASAPSRFTPALWRLGVACSLVVGLWWWGTRAAAYWRLHGAASQFANYASCMVGPTGPATLRDRPAEFWRLVRRRLIASPPEARPFASCGELLAAWPRAPRRKLAELARASEFREYAAPFVGARLSVSLDDLVVDAEPLESALQAAWPLAREGYAELVQPERHAPSALHPVDLARPSWGRGLPKISLGHGAVRAVAGGHVLVVGKDANAGAYRSLDGGKTWLPLDVDEPALRALEGQCSREAGGPSFRLDAEDDRWRVESWQGSERVTSFPLATLEARLLAFACDGKAALAVLRGADAGRLEFRLCPHRARCTPLPLPGEFQHGLLPGAVPSVARVRGVSVISVAHAGVVRVISSRDDGETWTPAVVAFDRDEYASPKGARAMPTELLALDQRVLLYAGAEDRRTAYPVLASDDFGASWRGD